MTKHQKPHALSRRAMLMGGGAFVVSVGAPISLNTVLGMRSAFAQGTKPPLVPEQLSSYIAIGSDGAVSAFFGKMDMGQGLYVSIGQIVAEELDVPFKAVTVFMADTRTSVNQGGASGSTGIQTGGRQMRVAAAEARRVLVEMAAEKLGTPADQLIVTDGIVSAAVRPRQEGHLRRTDRRPLLQRPARMEQADRQRALRPRQGQAEGSEGLQDRRPADQTRRHRAQGVLPGAVRHRRENPGHGACPHDPPAGRGRDAGRASTRARSRTFPARAWCAKAISSPWSPTRNGTRSRRTTRSRCNGRTSQPPFPSQDALYDHIRKAPVRKAVDEKPVGNVAEAFKTAARVIEAEYEWPFQSHACMGPACAVVEIKDGRVTCYTGSQKPHFVRDGLARTLEVPPANVDGIWVVGPGSYGRNDADDCAHDAAVLAKLTGKPVRLQYTREQGTGWDPKGPASIHKARAALDASNKVVAYEFLSKGFSRIDVQTNGSRPEDTLAGHFRGAALKVNDNFGVPAESYVFDNKRTAWETIAQFLERGSPLRGAHLRDPVGPQIHFASESFMDEVAHAIGADPVEFRIRYLKDPRDVAVIKAAAEKAGWQTRTSPQKQTGNTVSGRGIAYSQRNGTTCAIVAEVDVDRRSGKIWARKFTVAHDCGLIINPDGLKHTIEGNIIQGISRTLWEEVKFDNKNVTSVDWLTYPILDMTEAPQTIDCVYINRPDRPATGAGEPSIRPVAAAIANAVFDATGVRHAARAVLAGPGKGRAVVRLSGAYWRHRGSHPRCPPRCPAP